MNLRQLRSLIVISQQEFKPTQRKQEIGLKIRILGVVGILLGILNLFLHYLRFWVIVPGLVIFTIGLFLTQKHIFRSKE